MAGPTPVVYRSGLTDSSRWAAFDQVSLRVLVIAMVACALGAVAWRFPYTVNPMLIAVASYAVLDRITGRHTA